MFLTINLAALTGKADKFRKMILIKVFKNKETQKRHYVVEGLSK